MCNLPRVHAKANAMSNTTSHDWPSGLLDELSMHAKEAVSHDSSKRLHDTRDVTMSISDSPLIRYTSLSTFRVA